jgi:L-2-hydroxycarboxylate dehydrogenase (NAD+)
MRVPVERVRSTVAAALAHRGVPQANAEMQLDLLEDAQMRGVASHGLLRLPRVLERIANGVTDPVATGLHTWTTSNFLQVDGCMGLGPVVARRALEALVERSDESGVAVGAIANSNHLGMLAWYARWVAERGRILIAMTTSEALVHPWGGRQKMLGTNPIAIGVPAHPRPLVVDMATSLVSMGKIHDHANGNRPIPAGWALDADGEPTTDAVAATGGAIAPFGGAKGYALGLAIEVLVASLSGAALGNAVRGTLDSTERCNKGDVFVVLSPRHGAGVVEAVSAYLDEIRACAPAREDSPVVVPGDRADAARADAVANGVEIDAALWEQLLSLAQANH